MIIKVNGGESFPQCDVMDYRYDFLVRFVAGFIHNWAYTCVMRQNMMGMMSGIINDAKAMEAEAIRGEESAQKTYEEFVIDTNNSVEEHVKDIVGKSDAKAKAEGAKVEAESERDSVLGELEQLANENADLHKSCDFTLKLSVH